MGRTTEDLINEAMDKANKGVEQAVEHAKSFVPFGAPGASQTEEPAAAAPVTPETPETPPATPEPEDKAQAQAQTEAPAQEKTPAPQDKPIDYAAELEKLKKNYDHVRSYADRASGEKAELQRKVDDLTRKLNILLSATPQAQEPTRPPEPGGEPTGDTPVQGQPTPQAQKRMEMRKELEELAENFPDVMAPLLRYLDVMEESVKDELGRVKPVVDSIVQDTRTRAEREFEEARNKAHSDIEKGLPGWKNLVFANPANIEEEPQVNPALINWLMSHENGDLYRVMLFPDPEKGERGGSPASVVKILNEFKATLDAPSQSRIDAASQDAQTIVQPKGFSPQQAGGTALERLKANGYVTYEEIQQIKSTYGGNPQLYSEIWPLAQKAFAESRVIYPGVSPGHPY
ncbi:MAG TPA: hypothetical protein PLT33_12900 [Deltaproteobacteria bacterium]|nr:hypothetical protein [Deltaproteobacteria bacterium]HQQ10843.1 hypothetical protein [Synergistales bacterium]HNS90890.1 hypothetical protein [Deltaproteobacteria bacterium]HPA76791.1 hypothetical protein [Deltaproteobacteria bacterium]HPV30377.1 hypothetical protein [Deltaproteobacteria bacterium]